MISNFLTKLFGSKNERELKKIKPVVEVINSLENKMEALSDEDLKAQTCLFKQRIEQGETLESILPESFATVREASKRTLKMRHFDVQLIGGIILHSGKIAEMKTGEGKTLAATLPAYLNALTGKGVHIVTVNDYLAKRDTEWMGQIYKYLGLSIGTILHGQSENESHDAYKADITYGTNNEFGFDYLRDNMKYDRESIVQGYLNYAIVDEVDCILVDEARTPLIISGPAEKSTDLYYKINSIIPRFHSDKDFTKDEKARTVSLTEEGVASVEKILKLDNLYDPSCIEILHHVNQALKAHVLFKRDTDYIVKDNEVVIVDEFTGRLMAGRRYSEGLHQALEAKEHVKIENENQTLAAITFQNYFRMYKKLAGMTGTADTEAAEFKKIYNLDVFVIPTNQPMIRDDKPDAIYKTKKEKYDAVLEEIEDLNNKGQPVLVGTISIDDSELLSKKLNKRGIKHSVLNAKNHKKEADIISMAGHKNIVTISTNMAGRGTDIQLEDGVVELGGLHIIGTERHESRRIDNQLRGRSGRQGDHGSSRFYLALEDDLLRIFGGDRITGLMEKLGMKDGEPIEHKMISKAIENAQRKVEGHNFDIRKQLLEYDDVMNQQREIIYIQRQEALYGKNLKKSITEMVVEKAEEITETCTQQQDSSQQFDVDKLSDAVFKQFNFRLNHDSVVDKVSYGNNKEILAGLISDLSVTEYDKKRASFAAVVGTEELEKLERIIMLQIVDNLWKDHLLSMDHLKEGIGLRGYAQQNPLIVYKKEGFKMFDAMISRIKEEVVTTFFKLQIVEDDRSFDKLNRKEEQDIVMSHGSEVKAKTVRRNEKKIGRNDPCACGSGKKYKKCCG